jgi:uncharacterized protein YkwD
MYFLLGFVTERVAARNAVDKLDRVKLILLPLIAAALAGCAHEPIAQRPATARMAAGPAQPACGGRVSVDEVLQRINAVRASGYRCGGRRMAPASGLQWNAALYVAAARHSSDMASRNYFEHRSPEGTTVRHRASSAHYKFSTVGENIAAGLQTVPEAVQAWLNSPDHCENLMDPDYRDVAVACVVQPGSEYGTYWTMLLGRQQPVASRN